MTTDRSRFSAQAHRPAELSDVDVAGLTAFQRALLAHDGVVTDLIEAAAHEDVTVDVFEQHEVGVAAPSTRWLDLSAPASAVRRRVAIRGRASGRDYAVAESLIVPARLPPDFSTFLERSPRGLGEALARMRLRTRRELLWWGVAAPPAWAAATVSPAAVLTRSYRIVLATGPAILIAESFPLDDPTAHSHGVPD